MTTTLVGIDADLHEANEQLAKLQCSIIDAYEANELARARELEEELKARIKHRDDLVETKAYIVNKERQQETAGGRLSSVIYLSQFADNFSAADVPNLVFTANAKNELTGVTGILYILRGWFASYLEGNEEAIDRLIRKLRRDPRHQRFRIVERQKEVKNMVRRFPNCGLAVKHIETPQSVAQQNPEATMLFELSSHLKLQAYLPTLDATTRGRTHAELPYGSAVVLKRFMAVLKPHSAFFSIIALSDQFAVVERVMSLVTKHVEQSNNSSCQGAITGPHACDGVTLCFQTEQGSEVARRCLDLIQDIRRYPETAMYFPCLAVHYSEEYLSVMDGYVTFVGKPMRELRLHGEYAIQNALPLVLSEATASAMQLQGVERLTTVDILPGKPTDIFTLPAFKGVSWESEIRLVLEDIRRAAAAAATEGGPLHRTPSRAPGPTSSSLNTSQRTPAGAAPGGSSTRNGGGHDETATVDDITFPASKKRAIAHTSEEENQKPIKGFPTPEEMRALFETLRVEANGMISRTSLDGWLHSQDNAGVPVYNGEIDRVLEQFDAVGGPREYVTFDQFCLIAYQRLK